MSKFDQKSRVAGVTATLTSPVKATGTTTTHEGGAAYSRDAKGDLFLLAVVNMVGEDTFYESASDRDARFRDLVRQVTSEDPAWVARLIPWLRNEANMRSASVVAAVEYAKAGGPYARRVIDSACSRADEPAEVLAYAQSQGYKVAGGLKRGVADAAQRLYTQRNALKYDGQSRGWRMGDVIEVAHVEPKDDAQSALFKYLIDKRHNRENPRGLDLLPMIKQRMALDLIPVEKRRDVFTVNSSFDPLVEAGMTWESLSGWLNGPMDAVAWEAIIPSMGYMALLRNLRNFDQAGVSDDVADRVATILADPDAVARSRQFPYRFFSAYKATESLRWAHVLDKALTLSVKNIPSFTGKTLVLVDTSASMDSVPFSKNGTVTPVQAAAIFGVAMALKGNEVDLYGFANGDRPFRHDIPKGASLLKMVEGFVRRIGEDGHGTRIEESLRKTYNGHQRVVVVSDMQTFGGYYGIGGRGIVPASVPMYGFNLGGYDSTVIEGGTANQHEFGGMNDKTFAMISLLEQRQSASWPF